MKNIMSLKVVMIILVAILLISVSTRVFATEVITPDQYEGAEEDKEDKKEESLPQTGAEDYWVVMLAVFCVGSAMFAYRKVSDYRNI